MFSTRPKSIAGRAVTALQPEKASRRLVTLLVFMAGMALSVLQL